VEAARQTTSAGRAGALGVLGATAVLAAAYVLVSQVISPLFVPSACLDAVSPGEPPGCPDDKLTAVWWQVYGVLFPGSWRSLGLLGLAWLGAGAVGFIAAGLTLRGSRSGLAALLHFVAAAGALLALAAVAAIVRDTAPRDAPGEVGIAALLAVVGIVCLTPAGWLTRRAGAPRATTDESAEAV
jgi:hypothetical protein